MHARQTIREAIAALVTGLSTTGANVYQSRVYPHDTLPCLTLYSINEAVVETIFNGTQMRELSLIIEGRAKATSNLDDTLDTIAAEVETALMTDQYLTDSVKLIELTETEIDFFDDIEQPAGIVRLTFIVSYRTNETDPTTLID